ncbi:MAG: GNAT family N-acetyltransferase [Actinomycetota bacterium]
MIHTMRLRLEEVTADEVERIRADPPLVGDARPARWGPGFPLTGTRVATGMMARQMQEGSYREGFGVYEIVAKKSERVVGDIGFHGPPDRNGAVEVGYGVVPLCRRQRVASEALGVLCSWAFEEFEVDIIRARAEPGNVASLAVLRKVGFVDDGVWQGERMFYLLPPEDEDEDD